MSNSPKPVRIGLLGFGTVGQAFARLLAAQAPRFRAELGVDLAITAVASRRLLQQDTSFLPGTPRLGTDLGAVATAADVDLVVELLGGLDPARALVEAALSAGKPVVTANKMLLATHGSELAGRARERGAALGIEAAVAGGIPILRALRESFASDQVVSAGGILNGTCNFILTEMERTGRAYADVLAEAQRLGYAEADPASDVEGADASYKLVLLSRMAFGQEVPVDAVWREGITRLLPADFVYARMLGRTPRQLALARRTESGTLVLTTRTHLVSTDSMLAKVVGPFNAVQVVTGAGGEFVLYGRGAGGAPTATAVLADVLEMARSGYRPHVPPFGFPTLAPFAPAAESDLALPYYLRFVVQDQPGILAEISRCLAVQAINIDAVFQAPWGDKDALPFVITLEPVGERQLRRALETISTLPFHAAAPLALPMTP